MLYHLDNTFRNGARENITWVHIPVFFLASKTIITFCPYDPAALEVVEDTRPTRRSSKRPPWIVGNAFTC
jgi:hypothetical protein